LAGEGKNLRTVLAGMLKLAIQKQSRILKECLGSKLYLNPWSSKKEKNRLFHSRPKGRKERKIDKSGERIGREFILIRIKESLG